MRSRARRIRATVVAVTLVVLATAAAPGAAADGIGTRNGLRGEHAAVRAGCVNTVLDPVRCRFGPESARGTVLVAGDSQAYAIADGVIPAAASLGYDTIVTSHTGCPLLGRESSGVHHYPCRSWQRSVLDYAIRTRPAAVVIANLSSGYVDPASGWRTALTDRGTRATTPAEAAEAWRAGLAAVVEPLERAGIGVVLLQAVPQLPKDSAPGVSRTQFEASRLPALRIEQAIAAKGRSTTIADPVPDLCDSRRCAAVVEGTRRYQDATHLSVAGAQLLSRTFASAIERVTRR